MGDVVRVVQKTGTQNIYYSDGEFAGKVCFDTGRAMIGDSFWVEEVVDNNSGEHTALAKCPFCGSEAWLYSYEFHRGTDGFAVLCRGNNCTASLGETADHNGYEIGAYETEEEAIEAWNRRVGEQKAFEDGMHTASEECINDNVGDYDELRRYIDELYSDNVITYEVYDKLTDLADACLIEN